MNLNIEKSIAHPPNIIQPYIFTYIPILKSLLLHSPPQPIDKVEEPNKKKFAFKANNNAGPITQDVFLYDLASKIWKTIPTKGKIPTKRQNPAVALMSCCLMVYGGKQINPSKVVNDLYCLNVNNWQWKKLFVMQTPPAFQNPQAFTLNQQNLLIISKQLWVFSAKGINWQMQKGDLPGGIWQKLQQNLPFQVKCGHKINNNEILVFGYNETLKSSIIQIQNQKLQVHELQIKGQFVQQKMQHLTICNSSQGAALIINNQLICSFIIQKQKQNEKLIFMESLIAKDINVDKIIIVDDANYTISKNKEIFRFQVIVQKFQENISDEDIPNTARQIQNKQQISINSMNSQQKSNSQAYNQSQFNQSVSSPFSAQLIPLLAKEWQKRRILQEKGKLLESSIKKAEKIVLALCRYGSDQQKRQHIGKVRQMRQNLYAILNRESYLRKQMQQRPGERQLKEQAIKQQQQRSEYL